MMKKKSMGMAIVIFAIMVFVLFLLFSGMSGKNPYEMNDLSESETYLLDAGDTGELTDAEKKVKYKEYLENTLADDIMKSYPAVASAEINLPETEEVTQIEISLDLTGSLAEENLMQIAEAVAISVDNPATEDIVIQDTEGTILYTKSTRQPEG